MSLHDYIQTIPCLTEYICEGLINTFEEHKTGHIIRDRGAQHFTELNVNEHEPALVPMLSKAISQLREEYTDIYCPVTPSFPHMYALEEFRIKRYNEGDCFKKHVDVGDGESCKRFLAFLFYLNDDFEGGGTLFRTPDAKYIKPVTGEVVVFPPTWQYPHEGMKVTKGTKYIMSTYLHYVSPPA